MTSAGLHDVGILVTRPRAQATALVRTIEREGGRAIRFPVMEIKARAEDAIKDAVSTLPTPDIAVFASPNAVEHGLRHVGGGKMAAIGPATAAAIQAAGRIVDIFPASGYDSESLLDEPLLNNVVGKTVLIVRGNDGRELLADTLTERGATVNYLSVYDRFLAQCSPQLLADVESAWRKGEINAVTVMSVESLRNLITILPPWCSARLDSIRLVTPAARVIQEALDRYPQARPILATGPSAESMVRAMCQSQEKRGLKP